MWQQKWLFTLHCDKVYKYWKIAFLLLNKFVCIEKKDFFESISSVKTFIQLKTVSFFVNRLVQHVYTFHLVLHCFCYCLDTRNDVDRFSSFETAHIQKVSDCFFPSSSSSAPFDEAKRLYCSEGHSNIYQRARQINACAQVVKHTIFFRFFLFRQLSQGDVLLWLIEIRFPS